MPDNEIIKALECCSNQMYFCNDKQCKAKTIGNALDLINRQKAEIERLNNHIAEVGKKVKTDTAEDFAERLKTKFDKYGVDYTAYTIVDDVVREMVGVDNDT